MGYFSIRIQIGKLDHIRKLDVHNRTQAVRRAQELKLLKSPTAAKKIPQTGNDAGCFVSYNDT